LLASDTKMQRQQDGDRFREFGGDRRRDAVPDEDSRIG
jgi:hypothetical protein